MTKLTQSQLGELVGISKTTISMIINGNYSGNKNKEN